MYISFTKGGNRLRMQKNVKTIAPKGKVDNYQNYANLANQIVIEGINDYKCSLKHLAKLNGKEKLSLREQASFDKYERLKNDCERFFNSEYFNTINLTNVSGKEIMRLCQEGIL